MRRRMCNVERLCLKAGETPVSDLVLGVMRFGIYEAIERVRVVAKSRQWIVNHHSSFTQKPESSNT
jgi:hypothetical protein